MSAKLDKLEQIDPELNAFRFGFDISLLNEIRASYEDFLAPLLNNPNSSALFAGGRRYDQPVGPEDSPYYMVSYQTYPLYWFSNNNTETYDIYRRFFESLNIESDLKQLVDFDEKIRMYCGFLVIGNQAPEHSWHVDYYPGANAYTLITPLYDIIEGHGNLLYEGIDKEIQRYEYSLGEAIIFGDHFYHTTEPYPASDRLRVMLSFTCGTDKQDYWDIQKQTIGAQSRYMVLPNGDISER